MAATNATSHAPGTTHAHNVADVGVTSNSSRQLPYAWLGLVIIAGSIVTFILGSAGVLDILITDGDGLFTTAQAVGTVSLIVAIIIGALIFIAFTLRNSLVVVRDQMDSMRNHMRRMQQEDRQEALAAADAALKHRLDELSKQADGRFGQQGTALQQHQQALEAQRAAAAALQQELAEVNRRLAEDPSRQVEERLLNQVSDLEHRLRGVQDDLAAREEALEGRAGNLDQQVATMASDLSLLQKSQEEMAAQERQRAAELSEQLIAKANATANRVDDLRERLAAAEEAPRRAMEDITFAIKERSRFYVIMGIVFLAAIAAAVAAAWFIGDSPGLFNIEQAFLGTGLVLLVMTAAVATIIFGLADAVRIVKRRFAQMP